MKREIFRLVLVISIITVWLVAPGSTGAVDFPKKDITLICPWSPGGGTDTVSRALCKNAKKYFGVNVNVVNKTGGMGSIGMGAVAHARPDGHTVGMITFQLSTFRLMGISKLSYRDFELIQLVNRSAASISVASNSQFKTLKDVFDYAKKNPGVVTVGHSGAGGGWHLSMASLAQMHKVKFNYVPFDGAAPTRTAVVGGHIDVATTGIDEMLQFYKAGQVRILAINALERHPMFPDVPTVAEAGFPNPHPVMDWRALGATKGTPPEIMKVIRDGFKKCFDDPEFTETMNKMALSRNYLDHEKCNEFLANMEKVLEPALDMVGLLKKM